MRPRDKSTGDILQYLAGDAAEKIAQRVILPAFSHAIGEHLNQEESKARLENPDECLEVILGHYAFARRGKEKRQLSQISLEALHAINRGVGIEAFLQQPSAASLWSEFENLCIVNKRKPNPEINLGVIAGFAELAQDVYKASGRSIFGWIGERVVSGQGLEGAFLRIVDVRGVGPKLTAQLLRDVTWLYDIDGLVPAKDLIYVQPIDHWIRLLSGVVIEESDASLLADWVLAGKFAKTCRLHHVSSVRASLGCSWLGIQAHGKPQQDQVFLDLLATKLVKHDDKQLQDRLA